MAFERVFTFADYEEHYFAVMAKDSFLQFSLRIGKNLNVSATLRIMYMNCISIGKRFVIQKSRDYSTTSAFISYNRAI